MQGGGGLLVPFDHKIYSVTQTQQAISALQLLFRKQAPEAPTAGHADHSY
jgi:hypothetical protein